MKPSCPDLQPSCGPATLLHVKEKDGSYLRLILSVPDENVFLEKYAGWDSWLGCRNGLEILKGEVNREFLEGRPDQARQAVKNLGSVLCSFLESSGLPMTRLMMDDRGRKLDVYYDRKAFLLPFEALEGFFSVTHFLPGVNGIQMPEGDFALVYTETLEQTGGEVRLLMEILKDRHEIGVYSGPQFSGNRRDREIVRYLHFAGHGSVRNGKTCLESDPGWSFQGMEFAFLNCCHAGSSAGGVLSSLIEQGVNHVIASPYGIPDGFQRDVLADFYGEFRPGDIGGTFKRIARKYPDFGMFYRYFRSYRADLLTIPADSYKLNGKIIVGG